jgi:hypothetical protein
MAVYISLGIAVLGFLPLLIVVWKWRRIKKLKETGILVTGVVEDVIERRGYKGSRYFQGIFQYFVTGRGTVRSSYIFSYSKKPIYTRRQSVELYYRKDKPEKFIPKDAKQGKAVLIFTGIIAVAYIVFAFFIYDLIKNTGA